MHTDVVQHEAEFHDGGEHVARAYPQSSENPLRAGVAKIIVDNADGTYTIREQIWTGAAWTDGAAPGQYYDVTVRDINDSTVGSVDDIVSFWEVYDEDGLIELVVNVGLATDLDEKVATTSGCTPGYLEDVTAGHDPWIALTQSGGVITWTHAGPGASAYACGCKVGGCACCALVYMDLDCWGHVREFNVLTGPCCGPCAP